MKFYLKTHLYNIKSCDNWSFFVYQSIVATCHLCKTYWNNEALCSTWSGNVRNFQSKQESMMVRAYSVASTGRPFYGTLTRGDAYALPRAGFFWAFSPRVKALCQSPLSFYQTNIVCHRTLQNSRYLQTILSRKTNDPTPGMGKSVKRDSFNQTMFNQFIILLDY